MAGAATATTISTQLRTSSIAFPKRHALLRPTHLHSSTVFHHNKFLHHHIREGLLICHAKSNGESEDLNEVSFGPDESMEDYDCESDHEEEDNTESSVDLLLRLLHSMFKKVSKRARKASLSILPDVFSPQLVSFAVDGVLLLASLSILKALLEVACTLGGTVFTVILLLRVILAAVSYFQSSGTASHQSRSSYGRAQPIT